MRPSWELLAIAVGGGLGALVRYGVGEALPATFFPWSTFTVNVVGCALLAVVTAPTRPKTQQRVLGTGFCGGLTTFSTFTVEIATLTTNGDSSIAIIYLLSSLAVGFAAFAAVRTVLQPGPQAPPRPS